MAESKEHSNEEVEVITADTVGSPSCTTVSNTNESFLHGLGEDIVFVRYTSELQMPAIMKLIKEDLSEPYSIYTYRYFINNWPDLCWMAFKDNECIGVIISKMEVRNGFVKRGYIAMLAVEKNNRKRGIATALVKQTIDKMIRDECHEIVLEATVGNTAALHLYEKLGFVRDKFLYQYYLNGEDAYRLKLWLRSPYCD